jgi:hypothetical protein
MCAALELVLHSGNALHILFSVTSISLFLFCISLYQYTVIPDTILLWGTQFITFEYVD